MGGLLLAIDIGNTNIKLGTFDGDELTATWRLETDAVRMPDEYAVLLDWLLSRKNKSFKDISGVSMSSTALRWFRQSKSSCRTTFQKRPSSRR